MNSSAEEMRCYSKLLEILDRMRVEYPWFAANVQLLCAWGDDEPDAMGGRIFYSKNRPGHVFTDRPA